MNSKTLPPPAFETRRAVNELSEAEYAAKRCDEQELLDRYVGLLDKPDAELIDLIADPPALMSDADEVVAAAAIVLQRRIDGLWRRVPAA
jgi:hypothetical protein